MMKQSLKKWLTISVSAVLLAVAVRGIVWACAGGDWDGTESSDFAPEAFIDTPYTPFFFSDNYYYDIYYDTQHDTRFSDDNVREWTTYIGKGADAAKFVDYILNAADAKSLFSLLRSTKASLPDSVARVKSLKALEGDKTVQFVQYALFAKRSEVFATNNADYWTEDRKAPEANTLGGLEKELITGMEAAGKNKDAFLQQRYWFQLVRYYFFYDREKAIATFSKYANAFPKNHTYYRTLAYAAGAHYKQGRFAEANYYYSLVFAGDDQLKTVAHWSFHPQEERDWKQTLALCKTPEEKATCWQMLGTFYDDELRSMKEIYKLSSKSEKLDLLLSRLINKLEYDSEYSYRDTFLKPNRAEAYKWVKATADGGEVSNKFLWHVATGYLAFLSGDYATAHTSYAKAGSNMPSTTLANKQLRLLKLLADVGELKRISATDETRLLPELQWLLVTLPKDETVGALRYSHATDWVQNTMAKAYEAQGDIAKAECFVHKAAYYGNEQKVEVIRTFLDKGYKAGAYEAFCKEIADLTVADIDEMKGIKLAFKDDLGGAVALMKTVNNATELPGNPFNGWVNDCHDCDHMAPQKIKYTKLSFLEKLAAMEAKVKSGQEVYTNAILLGNAFYNMSFFGNARQFSASRIIEFGADPTTIDWIFRSMLVDNAVAEKYYKQALDAAVNDEQRAKATYMLAKCERNGWYSKLLYLDKSKDNEYYYGGLDTAIEVQIQRTWFAKLKQYQQTAYYAEVLEECGYFRNYLGK